ncbi:hypothetical protein LTR27_000427 [Elasticomyces elasticus]|nr:hypothetical protein LTR27_000427 [Elasticomyces elasticus]
MVDSALQHGLLRLQLKPMEDSLSAAQAAEIDLSNPERRLVKSGKFPVQSMEASDDMKWRDCDVTLLDNAFIITFGTLSTPTVSRKASVELCRPSRFLRIVPENTTYSIKVSGIRTPLAKKLYPLSIHGTPMSMHGMSAIEPLVLVGFSSRQEREEWRQGSGLY